MTRREFIASLPAAWAASQPRKTVRAPIIDGLGEIHVQYDAKLIDEIRASGLRGCVVTVGNPALQGASAFGDMKREIDAYDAHVKAHPDRFIKATRAADFDTAAERNRIAALLHPERQPDRGRRGASPSRVRPGCTHHPAHVQHT
jgi:hypothetical protein